MSKHKVGDIVTIRSDLVEGRTYGPDSFVYGMEHMLGKRARITKTWFCDDMFGLSGYKYKVEGDDHNWTGEMFEDESNCDPVSLDVSDLL